MADTSKLDRMVHLKHRTQSAMEFLMTYGWSILIIAVVVAILFRLGAFNGIGTASTVCITISGYKCQNLLLVTAGQITFNFGQYTGFNIYNVEFACAASSNAGIPNPATAFNSISSTGSALPASNTGNYIPNGYTLTISALPCYNSAGSMLNNLNIGSGFSGYIWLNYTVGAGPATAGSNPWHIAKVATVRTSAT